MEERRVVTSPRACTVCGHPMPPYMRICDNCGSIQRMSRTPSRTNPRDEYTSCKMCGARISADRKVCEDCQAELRRKAAKKKGEKKEGFFRRILKAVANAFRAITGGGRGKDG